MFRKTVGPAHPFSKDSQFNVVGSGLLIVASTYGLARYVYGLFVPAIQNEFHLSTASVGLLGSVSYAGYLLLTLIASTLSGRIGPRLPILAGGVAAVVGMTLIGTAPSLPWLVAGVLLAGTSPGLSYPPLSDAVVQLRSPARQARTYALINSGTSYGVILSAPLALWAGQQWQRAWLVFAAIAAVATVWTYWTMPGKTSKGRGDTPHKLTIRWFLKPGALPLFVAALLFGLTSAVYWAFSVRLVTGDARMTGQSAQLFWLLLGIAGIVGGGAGDSVGRFGLGKTFGVALLANAVAYVLLGLFADQFWAMLVSALLFGGTFILITGLFGIWSVHIFQQRPSAGFGATFFLISAGQLIAPTIVGAVADRLGLPMIFNVTAMATILLVALLPRAHIRQMSSD